MLKVRRVLSVLCLFVFLGLPLAAAQAEREPVSPVAGFLEAFWERLSAPLSTITAIWQADEGSGAEDPEPEPGSDTGGSWDPFG